MPFSTPQPSLSGPSDLPAKTYLVMGVAGSGKSLIGQKLGEALHAVFEDADDFHPPENKAKMSAGTPLTDEDRWPWMRILRARIKTMQQDRKPYVLACSGLKGTYRELLRGGDSPEVFQIVYLQGSRDLIGQRMAARKGHFMPTKLLDSQFATLEEPSEQEALVVSVDQTPEEIVAEILRRLS